jgi:hypothetical protein
MSKYVAGQPARFRAEAESCARQSIGVLADLTKLANVDLHLSENGVY